MPGSRFTSLRPSVPNPTGVALRLRLLAPGVDSLAPWSCPDTPLATRPLPVGCMKDVNVEVLAIYLKIGAHLTKAPVLGNNLVLARPMPTIIAPAGTPP